MPISVPPALMAPSLSVSYSSAGAFGDEGGSGWSISGALEITRPTAPADPADTFLVSGPEVSGLLVAEGGSYAVRATGGGRAWADYDAGTDQWTVSTGDVSFVLEPLDEAPGPNTARWRVTEAVDLLGNRVAWAWHADGRLDAVTYGGNVVTGDPALIQVEATYIASLHAHSNGASGSLEVFDHVLDRVVVSSLDGAAATPELAWSFHWTDLAEQEVLERIDQESASGALVREVASFEWSEHNPSAWSESLEVFHPGVTHTLTATPGSGYAGYSYVYATTIDLNGDGLPDALDTEGGSWWVTPGTYRGWGGGDSMAGPARAFNESVTLDDAAVDLHPRTIRTISRVADLNGDGFPDVIVSDDSSTWEVWYGTGVGFEDPVDESAPWSYSSTRYAVDAAFPSFTLDLVSDLIDVDGDGWLDAVWWEDGRYDVFLHTGVAGGGFEAAPWLDAPVPPIGAAMSEMALLFSGTTLDATEQRFGARDLNGDGRPDLVETGGWAAGTNEAWEVWFGLDVGWADDPVSWPSPKPYLERARDGAPAATLEQATTNAECSDMSLWMGVGCNWTNDGVKIYTVGSAEGGEGVWGGAPDTDGVCICNLSAPKESGIDQSLMDVDGDGAVDLVFTEGSAETWYRNVGDGFDPAGEALPAWWNPQIASTLSTSTSGVGPWAATTTTEIDVMVDLDGDGLLDRAGGGEAAFSDSGRPYLLSAVVRPEGGVTEVTYRPVTQLEPAGEWAPAFLGGGRFVVDTIVSTDPHTGHDAVTEHDYADGYQEGGIFWGFASTSTTSWLDDVPQTSSETEYALSWDLPPEAVVERLYTVAGLDDDASTPSSTLTLRSVLETTYEDVGLRRVPVERVLEAWGEDNTSVSTILQTWAWSANANLESWTHDGGGVPSEAIAVDLGWESDPSGTVWRMVWREVSGFDPLGGAARTHVRDEWAYDDLGYGSGLIDGVLTGERRAAGFVDGGELLDASWLSWTYARGPRGGLEGIVDEVTLQSEAFTLTLGEALRESSTNDLGHTTTWVFDPMGREVQVTEPSGVVRGTEYDGLGRPIESWVDGVGLPPHTTSTQGYADGVVPAYTWSSEWGFGGVERTTYAVQDGFGQAYQEWSPKADGTYAVVVHRRDLAGNELETTHPVEAPSFARDAVSYGDGLVLSQMRPDAFGEVRHRVKDVANGIGLTGYRVEKAEPQITLETDEEGYQKRITYDAHGRVTWVEEGIGGNFQTTGRYWYDPEHRLVRFVDGGGTAYEYGYDGAGRLREVSWGTNPDPLATSWGTALWVTYDYDGVRKTGQVDADGQTVVWFHDAIGRVIEQVVSDVDPSTSAPSESTYTWTWDTEFVGQVSSTTDPFGGVAFMYDGLGYETSAARSWLTGPDTVFLTEPDLQGRPDWVTFPTGRVVDYERSNGVLTRTTIGPVTIDHTYTSWGAPESWTSNVGASGFTEWNTPLWPSMVELTNGSMVRDRTYTWHDNGLMSERGATGKFTETYAYDGQRQLVQVDELGVGLQESYAYDGAGNITVHTDRASRTWTHSPNNNRNQISGRSDGTVSEGYTYDGAGRLAVVTVDAGSGPFPRSSYVYDGLGRLVIATDSGDTWSYGRDAAVDVVVRSGLGGETRSFRGWTKQSGGAVSEDVAPMLTYAGTERRWHLKEVDGTTVVTSKDLGMVVGHRRQGVYGQRFVEGGSPERKAAFHGRWEEEAGLVAMGPRHVNRVDGRWLQPEPLLMEGIPQESLRGPRVLASYRYSRNCPSGYRDQTGYDPAPTTGGITVVVALPTQASLIAGMTGTGAVIGGAGFGSARINLPSGATRYVQNEQSQASMTISARKRDTTTTGSWSHTWDTSEPNVTGTAPGVQHDEGGTYVQDTHTYSMNNASAAHLGGILDTAPDGASFSFTETFTAEGLATMSDGSTSTANYSFTLGASGTVNGGVVSVATATISYSPEVSTTSQVQLLPYPESK